MGSRARLTSQIWIILLKISKFLATIKGDGTNSQRCNILTEKVKIRALMFPRIWEMPSQSSSRARTKLIHLQKITAAAPITVINSNHNMPPTSRIKIINSIIAQSILKMNAPMRVWAIRTWTTMQPWSSASRITMAGMHLVLVIATQPTRWFTNFHHRCTLILGESREIRTRGAGRHRNLIRCLLWFLIRTIWIESLIRGRTRALGCTITRSLLFLSILMEKARAPQPPTPSQRLTTPWVPGPKPAVEPETSTTCSRSCMDRCRRALVKDLGIKCRWKYRRVLMD